MNYTGKRKVAFSITFLFVILSAIGITGCKSEPKPVEELCGDSVGAYFITDESYESYVHRTAEAAGLDEQWVLDVLNGGDGGEWHYLIRPKAWYWCVIADNQIRVAKGSQTIYDISVDENNFIGTCITETISFWFDGDILCIKQETSTMEYKKDSTYQRTETKQKVLDAPKNIRVSISEDYGYVTFDWNYQSGYGTIGAKADIKTANSKNYEPLKIDQVYMNSLVIQIYTSALKTGKNWVRMYHVGGPTITNSNLIIVEEDSDYVTYCITVHRSGKISVGKSLF